MKAPIAEELKQLHDLSHKLPYVGTGMMDGTGTIPGAGFFPCAWGSLDAAQPISRRAIMVLGQDQDRVSGLAKSLRRGDEFHTSTWRNMEALFADAGLPMEACFFTNFIMGVRQDDTRNTGPSPALAHPDFMRACSALFMEQLSLLRPEVIITLGMIPFQLLSLISDDFSYRALGITEFKEIDARNMHINEDVVFDNAQRTTATVIALCHPCQPQNGRARHFSNGIADEVDLLAKAFAPMREVWRNEVK
ncbi:MAG: hypothetical protein K8H89_13145 [Flavobacteriales bacterium]|nr:hypothetical protein [Flavobacteriales bacterium]